MTKWAKLKSLLALQHLGQPDGGYQHPTLVKIHRSGPKFSVPQHTARYGWYVPVQQGTDMSGTSAYPYVPCVGMLGMAQYSSIHTILIAGQYIDMDR